jgi:hypothetical protein
MPINPNIALGAQPQQPVNMLGQVGQMLALKAATEEMRGNEDLRAAYAQGGDLNDPEFRRKVMAANPKLGSQLIKTNAETGKLQNEAIANRIKLSREMLTGVNTPEDYIAWHEANHKDPVLGGYLNQRGVTAEQSRAKIIADLAKPGGLDRLKRESALGATELQKELMQTERTRISSGPAYQQAALAQKEFDLKKAESDRIAKILQGEFPTTVSAPVTSPIMGGGGPTFSAAGSAPISVGGGAPAGANSSIFVNPNVLATQVTPTTAPAPNVNALAGGGDVQQQIAAIDAKINSLMGAGSKAIPIVQALIAQKNSILTAEKNKYGEITTLEGINPDTNKPETYRARFNNITKQYEAIPKNEPMISVGETGSTSSQLNVAKPPQTPTPFQSELGTQQARKVVESRTIAQDAASIIETNDIGRKILDSGAITGAGANFFVGLNQALKTAGIDAGYADAAANSQAYVALMAQNTAKLIKQFGAGTGLSDADREYAMKAAGGQINLDEKAMRRVLDINDRAARNSISRHNESVKGIKSDIPLTVEMPKAGSTKVYTSTEQQALEWANSNANDPRAAQIKQRLGVQ